MTPEEQKQQVREALAKLLCSFDIHLLKWEDLNEEQKVFLRARADQILNLKYANGEKMLGILDEKQELPKMIEVDMTEMHAYQKALLIERSIGIEEGQQSLLKTGWKKCL